MNPCSTHIAIISIYNFPIGLAPTNRILAYAKGLVENGANVKVFIPWPTEKPRSDVNITDCGEYQGIAFYFSSGKLKSKYKLFRVFSVLSGYRRIKGFITSYTLIKKQNKKLHFDSLIISTDQIHILSFYSYLAKKIKAHSIFIFDEFPKPIRNKLMNKVPWWKEGLLKIVLMKVDAYISISEELKKYYNGIAQKKTFILPLIVDISRFNMIKNKTLKSIGVQYICYMGNMELAKDDVDNIIMAFSLIAHEYPKLELRLYGSPKKETKVFLTKLIFSLNLQQRVHLMGKVNSELVPEILCNAYILVSSQPDTKRASGGFPTKLGEYLVSGTPTLLTDVGENAKYVDDEVHVFFVKPGNYFEYAKKMKFIINNYDVALEVAKNGKICILENYSNVKKGKELLEFIEKIGNN